MPVRKRAAANFGDPERYQQALAGCLRTARLTAPSFPATAFVVDVALTHGATSGDTHWRQQRGVSTIFPYDPSNPRDQAIIQLATRTNRRQHPWARDLAAVASARPGVAGFLQRHGAFPRLLARVTPLALEVDVANVPPWAMPASYLVTLGDSVASARDGMTPLLRDLGKLSVDHAAAGATGVVKVHSGWVERHLDEPRIKDHIVPFDLLPLDVRILDEPFARSARSVRRMLCELSRLATSPSVIESPDDPRNATTLEERLAARYIYNDLLSVMATAMHATYQAHFQTKNESRIRYFGEHEPVANPSAPGMVAPTISQADGRSVTPFRVDLTVADIHNLPATYVASNQAAARHMIAVLTDTLAVQHRTEGISAPELVGGFLRSYVDFHDSHATGAVRPHQRIGTQALPPDELLLNTRMIDTGIHVFRSFISRLIGAASQINMAWQTDLVGSLVDGTVLAGPLSLVGAHTI